MAPRDLRTVPPKNVQRSINVAMLVTSQKLRHTYHETGRVVTHVRNKHRPTFVGFLLLRCTTSVHGLLATVRPRFTDLRPDPSTASGGRVDVPAGVMPLALDEGVLALDSVCRTAGTFSLVASVLIHKSQGRRCRGRVRLGQFSF